MSAKSEVEQLLYRIRELEAWRARLVLPEVDLIPAWDDQQINISSVKLPGAGAPSWTLYKGTYVLVFSDSADEIIYFTAELAHGYREATNIEFHIHLAYPDNNAGDTQWIFTYSWANVGAMFPAETGVSATIASPTTADYHQLAEIENSINGAGKTISSVLLCSLKREGTSEKDTYGSAVYLVALDFHIQINSLGSRTELAK